MSATATAVSRNQNKYLNFLRNTMYVVQSEPVKIAPDNIDEDVEGIRIQLDKLYDGFETRRWIIVAGERTDVKDENERPLPGIHAAELRTVSGIEHVPYKDEHVPYKDSPGDTPHTVVTLDQSLTYSYKRSTVTVYGNVVEASHGETLPTEVLGSGNAAVAFPRFQMKRPPLTYVSASTTSGIQGTEVVWVNNMRYRRIDSLLDTNEGEKVYELVDDENGIGTLTFGSRLPTGQENIRASYRVGIGREGNVKAEQISLLASRPLGVQGVINPLKASGGADRDGPERIRRNVPLATLALGSSSRLVSVSDYASFALRFAGIGHAYAQKLAGGWVHVTVAGVDDIPLGEEDELLTNLRHAYREFGDPSLQVAISVRELKALVLQAKVVIDPDYEISPIETQIRESLLNAFSFERSALGKSVYLSDVIAVMQNVRSVDWVDVDLFGGISESVLLNKEELVKAVEGLQAVPAFVVCAKATTSYEDKDRAELWKKIYDEAPPRFLPAQLAYLVPEVPSTLALNLSQR
ncbi:putative baseplate assembly protein [Methylobacter marinus]|uniref:putative baseplate assembly protein n=1 Tax=Methylobacter marinus TaxID=34058 RepID=UPI0003A15986|nr:putative baseplate assembly protein [Methylobacter marinus]